MEGRGRGWDGEEGGGREGREWIKTPEMEKRRSRGVWNDRVNWTSVLAYPIELECHEYR